MRLSVKIFVGCSILLVALIIVRVSQRSGGKDIPMAQAPPVDTNVAPAVSEESIALANRRLRRLAQSQPRPRTSATQTSTGAPPNFNLRQAIMARSTQAVATAVPPSQAWETQVDDVLTSTTDDAQKALQLVAMIRQLPNQEAQVEAAEHATNLLPDEHFAVVSPILLDPKTDIEVLEVLVTDLLDRPNTIKLPLLLQLARLPNHPHQLEAQEDLSFYLDQDFGTNWDQWEQSVAAYLRDNPE